MFVCFTDYTKEADKSKHDEIMKMVEDTNNKNMIDKYQQIDQGVK